MASTPMLDYKESLRKELDSQLNYSDRYFEKKNSERKNVSGYLDNGVIQQLIEECKKPQTINNYNYTMNFYIAVQSEEDISRFEKMLSVTTKKLGLK